jgi:hypothetical protein
VLEVPYYSALQQFGEGRYHPMMLGRIGQTSDTCPTRSLWWLALAGAAGVAAGYYVAKSKKGRR